MIKRIVDALRSAGGYSGIAVYRGPDLLFNEGWEPELAGRLREILELARSRYPDGRTTLIVRGYTIAMLVEGDLEVICRSEGRFCALPVLPAEEPEFAVGQAPAGLITREEARKEAAAMLKMLLGQG